MKNSLKSRFILWITLISFLSMSLVVFHKWHEKQGIESIQALSWVVAGRTYIIDPGHGGEDPGKVGLSGAFEKDINLAIAQKLNTIVNQGGGKVVMTRDQDMALSNNEDTIRARKRADLAKRAEIAETAAADVYIALHCNSFPSGRWSGAQTFYSPHIPGSKELAEYIQGELVSQLGNTTRKPKTDTTSIIFKRAQIPIVNVEMGFLSNAQEEKLLRDPAYQDKIAWAIYSGVVQYLAEYGDSYKPTLKYIEK